MCRECDVKRLREQFPNWTSGSKEIDAIIQKSQETVEDCPNYWEWIKPKQFKDIKHLADGGFSSVYKATWIDGLRNTKYSALPKVSANSVPAITILELQNAISQHLSNQFP